ncbi:hypothetical protein BC941DRAFT_474145 [Chlamydoabsidia padenii]|nr:hypothetical protein BC941DRAFT_474145 [Chlamydoabsidia padenii]
MEKHYPTITNSKQIPSALSTTISTPFIDAYENVTKEFDQFYGFISKVMSPRRTQPQGAGIDIDNKKIHKTLPKNTTKIRQEMDRRRNISTNSSLLTPMMERHSLVTSPHNQDTLSSTSHYASIPTLDRRRRQNDYPPPRPMTLTPNTIRTASSICLQPNEDDIEDDPMTSTYIHSPHRAIHKTLNGTTITPTRSFQPSPFKNRHNSNDITTTCPPSPSLMLHNHLLDESRRLEQLQRNVLLVQQQSLALSSSSVTTQRQRDIQNTTRQIYESPTDTGIPSTRQQHRHPLYHDSPSCAIPPLVSPPTNEPKNVPVYRQQQPKICTHYSPQKSKPSSTMTKASNKVAYLPAKRSNYMPTTSPILQHVSSSLPPSHKDESNNEQQYQMDKLLDDIPKAQLRSTETITTPNGSRIRNKIWDEIHGGSNTPSSPQQQTPPNEINVDKRKKRKSINSNDDESFWISNTEPDDQHSRQRQQCSNSNNFNSRKMENPLTNRLEKAKSIDYEKRHYNTNNNTRPKQQNRYYPADFFGELSHTLKNKVTMTESETSDE